MLEGIGKELMKLEKLRHKRKIRDEKLEVFPLPRGLPLFTKR